MLRLRKMDRAEPAVKALSLLLLSTLVLFALGGCSTAPPPGTTPVTPFDVARYAGTWYEIARLDHVFERGLTDVSASYVLEPDGSVRVVNRGYDPEAAQWREAVGRARFTGDRNTGSLEVSFFGPFYGGYHVVALDQQGYRWALVAGADRDYLWILSRDRQLPPGVREELLRTASALGFDTARLIWVEHTRDGGA